MVHRQRFSAAEFSMYQSVLTFITFLCLWTHVWAHVVVINVLHDSNSNASKAGLMAVQFLEQMKLNAAECGTQVTCEVYVSKSASANMSQAVKADLTRIAKRQFMFHGVTPITDTSVGSYVPEEEHVSEILSSLDENVKRHASPTEALISLSFTSYSYPIFGKSFHHILNNVSSKTNPVDVLLFEKTKELTSVSDWHDLMIVAVGLREGAKAWCRLLSAIYKRHAARDVFTLLPPRPAIIETALRIRDKVSIAYIPASAVCVAPLEDIPPERFTRFFRHGGHTSYCGALPTSNDTMKIDCGDSKTYSSHVCATVHSPQGWRRDAHPLTDPISDRYRNDFSSNPLDFASVEDFLRYRNATDPETPADFCWNTGCAFHSALLGL